MPEFVFVNGDIERGKLAEGVTALTGVLRTFRAKKDSLQKKAFTPLQGADILAYEMSLLSRWGTPRGSFSYPFQALKRMPGGILKPQRSHRRRRST